MELTPSTAKTLLLLTTGPRFDRIAIKAAFESTKTSAGHTKQLLFEEPSTENVFPNAVEVQIDLIMANQHALERRIDKMESLMLQILKALQKGN